MNAYVDHNFLINCVNDENLRRTAIEVVRSEKVSFILSPWHFYEIGKTKSDRSKELISVVENLRPRWILERFDLQVAEFRQEWGRFWGTPYIPLEPIERLPATAAKLLGENVQKLEGFSLTDYIEAFSFSRTADIRFVQEQHREVTVLNQLCYRLGKMTRPVKERIERDYIAQQLTCLDTKFTSHAEHDARLASIRSKPLLVEKIKFFVGWGGMQGLRAWEVESILTDSHWSGTAALNANRLVDRQHAIPALAYCDLFLTNDKELLKRCAMAREAASFRLACAITPEVLFSSLSV